MVVHLSAETERLLAERMSAGGFDSPDDAIAAALVALETHSFDDFAPGELDALLAEGEGSAKDGLHNHEAVMAELRNLVRARRTPP